MTVRQREADTKTRKDKTRHATCKYVMTHSTWSGQKRGRQNKTKAKTTTTTTTTTATKTTATTKTKITAMTTTKTKAKMIPAAICFTARTPVYERKCAYK